MRAALFAAFAALFALAACAAGPAPEEAPPAIGDSRAETGSRTGEMCGGIAGIACAAGGDYCAYEAGACVEIADAAGLCRARPQICTMEYAPVCGCDGKTYPNACSAAAAGVSVAARGECADG